ncbi:hypothetical protein T492DRAFT_896344 [Pavlovales sp. CCMP2436]|nr:hypothetical protein T492DRAFT_896344 [Pavlovales sp. CCMP2436]
MRALQADVAPEHLAAVDAAFMALHSTLDLPMALDGEAFTDPEDSRFARDTSIIVGTHHSRTQALQQQVID